jgi:class I lanthipeptide synthase
MPPPQRCLYALLTAGREHHESILRDLVTPVARRLRGAPELDSLFFARYNVPEWQIRFRILGRPEWVDGPVRELLAPRIAELETRGELASWEYATYQREWERYGGEEGMALAEEIFFHDSCLCLDLMEAEREGRTAKSRREVSLLYADRFLDLMEFDRAQRLAFYAHGYGWALEMKTWEAEELTALDARYAELRDGLADLLYGSQRTDPSAAWGGDAPAAAAERALAALAPVTARLREAHAAGRIPQEIVYLVWSYTHMHCNRLGIDPSGEAILRYFVHRLLLEGGDTPV